MSNETRSSSFPTTLRDVSLLKQTATDAATDLGNMAVTQASKAKDQFSDLVVSARDYAAARPLACIGAALALGFLVGLSLRGSRNDD